MRSYLVAHLSLLTLSAPWLFLVAGREITVAGLPLWAVYTVGASTLYAVFVSICIAKHWDANAEKGGE